MSLWRRAAPSAGSDLKDAARRGSNVITLTTLARGGLANTPLLVSAVCSNSIELVTEILANPDVRPNDIVFDFAHHDHRVVSVLAPQYGVDFDFRRQGRRGRGPTRTASLLGLAASAGNLEMIQALLKGKCSPAPSSSKTKDDKPGERHAHECVDLIFAVTSGQESCVLALLEAKSDINAFDEEARQSALAASCRLKAPQMTKLLIERGANAKDERAVWQAVSSGTAECLSLLVQSRANVSHTPYTAEYAGVFQGPLGGCPNPPRRDQSLLYQAILEARKHTRRQNKLTLTAGTSDDDNDEEDGKAVEPLEEDDAKGPLDVVRVLVIECGECMLEHLDWCEKHVPSIVPVLKEPEQYAQHVVSLRQPGSGVELHPLFHVDGILVHVLEYITLWTKDSVLWSLVARTPSSGRVPVEDVEPLQAEELSLSVALSLLFGWAPKAKNKARAARIFQELSNSKADVVARAMCISHGFGVPRNGVLARQMLMRAASDGHAIAQYLVARAYDEDYKKEMREMYLDLMDQDLSNEVSLTWYRKSAEQGFSPAQVNLGYMYSNGVVVQLDKRIALQWYGRAAAQNDATAQYNMSRLYKRGYGGVPLDLDIAKEWTVKSANNNSVEALFDLGYNCFNNHEYKEAAEFWSRAAELHDVRCMFLLADLYLTRLNDPGLSRKYLRQAAAAGHEKAIVVLAASTWRGRGN